MATILITGASGNLGRAVTDVFISTGYKVIAIVAKKESISDLGKNENLQVEVADLTNESASSILISNLLKTYKNIDAALLLVGGFAMGSIEKTKLEDIHKQISLNFDTAYTIVQPLFRHMLERNKGKFLFIGSRPALKDADGKNTVAYSLSKSLLFKLAAYINEEGKEKNITATVIVPSIIDTPENRKSMPNADASKWVKPEAIGEIIEFIISEKGDPLKESIVKVYGNS